MSEDLHIMLAGRFMNEQVFRDCVTSWVTSNVLLYPVRGRDGRYGGFS